MNRFCPILRLLPSLFLLFFFIPLLNGMYTNRNEGMVELQKCIEEKADALGTSVAEFEDKTKGLLKFLCQLPTLKENGAFRAFKNGQELGGRTASLRQFGHCYGEKFEQNRLAKRDGEQIRHHLETNYLIKHGKLLVNLHAEYLEYEIEKVEKAQMKSYTRYKEDKLQTLCADHWGVIEGRIATRFVEMPTHYPNYSQKKPKPEAQQIKFDNHSAPEMRLIAYEVARSVQRKHEMEEEERQLEGKPAKSEAEADAANKSALDVVKSKAVRVINEVIRAVPLNNVRNSMRTLADVEAEFIYELAAVEEQAAMVAHSGGGQK